MPCNLYKENLIKHLNVYLFVLPVGMLCYACVGLYIT